MAIPQRVRIVEVGPRDGSQNEKQTVPTEIKIGADSSGALGRNRPQDH